MRLICWPFPSFFIISIFFLKHRSFIQSFLFSYTFFSHLLLTFSSQAHHHGQCTIIFALDRCNLYFIFLSSYIHHLLHHHHLHLHTIKYRYLKYYDHSCVRLSLGLDQVLFLIDELWLHYFLSSWNQFI